MKKYRPHTEYQETTMQVPFGTGSVLDLLINREITPIEAILALVLNYKGNWQSGKTHYISRRKCAALLGISTWYLRKTIVKLRTSILKIINVGQRGTMYQLKHHLCDDEDIPRNADGLPSKFAIPHGIGSPFARLFAGDIHWKSCLIWIVLKRFSNWTTGITNPCTMELLAKRTRFGKSTVCECIAELSEAGLLERLSLPHEKSVFQLYPKPPEKRPVKRYPKIEQREMRAKGEWRYSFNEKYRVNVETFEIEQKQAKKWKPVRDRDRHRIPKPIAQAFDEAATLFHTLRNRFAGGPHEWKQGPHEVS